MTNTAKSTRPFYAVRVVVTDMLGSTSTRDYVRGETRMSRDTFGQFALGNLLSLASDGESPVTWTVTAISESEVS